MAEENKTALSAAQVDEALQTLAGWTRSEAVLARHFVFHTFEEITAFLTHLEEDAWVGHQAHRTLVVRVPGRARPGGEQDGRP
jgi:pterin-4a-carbinolamine dehydratase